MVPGLALPEAPELSAHRGEEIQALTVSLPRTACPRVLCMPAGPGSDQCPGGRVLRGQEFSHVLRWL